MVQGPLNKYTTSQQPPQSSSIPTHPPQSSSQILPVPPPPPRFLDSWKKSTTGRQFTYRALFWKFCIQEMWCKESLMHKKQLVKLLMRLSRAEQSLAATGKRWLWLIRHNVKIYYIVDIWTATGIRVQPTQGKVLKSLAAASNQKLMNGWLTDWRNNSLRQTSSLTPLNIQHPGQACNTFTRITPRMDGQFMTKISTWTSWTLGMGPRYVKTVTKNVKSQAN